MKLKPYPAYKDSGVEWLGEVPDSWIVQPLKYSTKIYTGNSLNDAEKKLYESADTGSLPYISSKDIDLSTHEVQYENGLRIPREKNELKIALKGSFLLCIEGGSAGKKVALLSQDVCFVNKLCCFTSKSNSKFKYYFTQTQNFKDKFELSVTGLIGGVSTSLLKNFSSPIPSTHEQSAIVTFLDRETGKLDTLIAKQEKLIELLQEKRHAVISHAVTKGLDPDAPMKDSGVEWLGEVPSNWEVWQSRRLFSQRKDRLYSDDQQLTASQKYGVIPQKMFMELENQHVMQVFTGSEILKHVEPNDFVISMRTFQGGIEYCGYRGCVSSAYVPLIPSTKIIPTFFRYLFKSITYIQALQSTSNLVRDGQALRFENFTQIPLPMLPLEEQERIADFLDQETAKIDKLIEKSKRSIELAKEHRTALISAAVTGKIDVREYSC